MHCPDTEPVVRLEALPDVLHVLPRHRLLSKPHGFEGVFAGEEPNHPNDLPIPDRPDRPLVLLFDLHSAGAPTPPTGHDGYDLLVARVDQFLQANLEVRPCLVQVAENTSDFLVSAIEPASQQLPDGAPRRVPLNLRVIERKAGGDITATDGLEDPAHHFDVLPRHRPRSIAPHTGGRAGAGRHRADFVLDVVGDGPSRAELEGLATALELDDAVTFHGIQAKAGVARFMANADFFVLPSHEENLPCVVIEAMASGLPVVATDVGGVAEMIDERRGTLVPDGDRGALADAIDGMLDRHERYDRDHLVAYSAKRFSYDAVGRKFSEIYAELLDRRARAASTPRQ